MKILAIETSCDETAIAIVERKGKSDNFKILAHIVSSQAKLHAKFGGVVPNLASREHQKNLVPILIVALKEAKLYRPKRDYYSSTSIYRCIEVLQREQELARRFLSVFSISAPMIDAIAVTHGPGLEPALWVGINFAKALALLWKKSLIPINHMEGHIFSALIRSMQKKISDFQFLRRRRIRLRRRISNNFKCYTLHAVRFPALALLVSGGHTELVRIKKLGTYTILGETLDDAVGEAFDKVAKMLNLGYPGGPIISAYAEKGNANAIAFPRPMIHSANFHFSFSGLKTSVLYHLRDLKLKTISHKLKADIAASFQQAAVDVLVAKTKRAIKKYGAKTFIMGGGVAANKKLREELAKNISDVHMFFPSLSLTGDNALMIALAAFFRKQKSAASIRADGSLRLR